MKIEWKIINFFFSLWFFCGCCTLALLLVCSLRDFNFWLMMLDEWSIDFMRTFCKSLVKWWHLMILWTFANVWGKRPNEIFIFLISIWSSGLSMHWHCYFLKFGVWSDKIMHALNILNKFFKRTNSVAGFYNSFYGDITVLNRHSLHQIDEEDLSE